MFKQNSFSFRFFSILISFVLVLFILCYFPPVLVHASSSIYITQGFTNINAFSSYEQQFLNTHVFSSNTFQVISNRSGVNSGILSFDFGSMHNWGVVSVQGQSYNLLVNRPSRSSSVDYIPSYMDYQGNSITLESQTFFVALPVGTFDFAYLHNFSSDFLNGSNGFLDQYSDSDIVFWGVANGNYDCRAKSFNTFYLANSFSPDYELVPMPYFSLDVDGFYDWIINNNKLSELPSYIVQAKLKSFIEFYKQFGSSNSFFISKISDWFSHMNIANQSLSNRTALKSSIDKLYQDYINYRSGTHAYWPGATKLQERDSIDTVTNNNNTSLITDDSNDDIYTKLLRDILRGVISISNNVVQGCSDIVNKLDHINFTVNVANNGGLSSGTDLSPVLSKMDDIIDKLEADTVSVNIDQATKDDTDVFFDDWNLEFCTALNNKFPVASQLRTFFTGFFERCGIDADSDGEVYQYYNPGVLSSSSVSRSVGTASEADIVTEFLGKFDNSDPSFLDDASYHGVPDLSVSVGGHSVSIIDFRVYAKYRDKIHFIISFVIWTLYLLHLYKALPQIIGQVADVAVKTSDL